MDTRWNKDMEKRILRKSRFTLTFQIIRILVIAFIVLSIYSGVLQAIGYNSKAYQQAHFYSQLAIEWTIPNVRANLAPLGWEMSLLGLGKTEFPVYKRIGTGASYSGDAELIKSIFPTHVSRNMETIGNEQVTDFSFAYPVHPGTGEKLHQWNDTTAWETLEMLPEGTVGELAFSTTEILPAKELLERLEKYDLDVTWMALHTGEYETYKPSYYTEVENEIFSLPLGLVGGYTMYEDFMGGGMFDTVELHTLEESEQAMLTNIKAILEKSEAYREQFLGLPDLEERLSYLNEEGFNVYGAVVTGPSKELLKLKDEEGIVTPQLGKVELWNWQH